jgi:diguanylate cyclase (GGDEF)-like protein
LVDVATAIQACFRRPSDLAARYGGEEFGAILPDTEPFGAESLAEAARNAVARLRILHDRSTTGPFVTISAGVAIQSGIGMTAESPIAAADRALFEAKRLGKNRIVALQAQGTPATAKIFDAMPRLAGSGGL